jgi:photosystem II stability/assembly factor-like uncharacterized protein
VKIKTLPGLLSGLAMGAAALWLPLQVAMGAERLNNLPATLEQPALATDLAAHSALNAIAQAGERLVVAGMRGHILYSDDQGNTWTQASVPVSVSLTGLCFADAEHGWAVGHRGAVLATRDGGRNWSLQLDGFQAAEAIRRHYQGDPEREAEAQRLVEEGADKPLLSVQCLGGQQVLAVGAYGLAFASSDAGRNWQLVDALFEGSEARHLNALDRRGDQLYLAGELGGLMRIGTDLQGFQRLSEPYEGSFFGVLHTAAGNLLAFGLRGHLFRSEDGGASWRRIALDTSKTLTAGTRLADGRLLLADESGQGWLSRDDGRSFQPVGPQRRFPLVALQGTADGGSLAVGTQGITRFTPDALR